MSERTIKETPTMTTMTTNPKIPTVTAVTIRTIANELGRSFWSVKYAIKTRGIKPVGVAGRTHLFPPSALAAVRDAMVEIDRNRRDRGQPASAP